MQKNMKNMERDGSRTVAGKPIAPHTFSWKIFGLTIMSISIIRNSRFDCRHRSRDRIQRLLSDDSDSVSDDVTESESYFDYDPNSGDEVNQLNVDSIRLESESDSDSDSDSELEDESEPEIYLNDTTESEYEL